MICFDDYTKCKCLIAPNLEDNTQELVIGNLAADTSYLIFIHAQGAYKTKSELFVTDVSGQLKINLAAYSSFFFNENEVYFIWVVSPYQNMTEFETVFIDGENYTLFKVEFKMVQQFGSEDTIGATALQKLIPEL